MFLCFYVILKYLWFKGLKNLVWDIKHAARSYELILSLFYLPSKALNIPSITWGWMMTPRDAISLRPSKPPIIQK